MEENLWGNCSYDLEMYHEVTESLCNTNNSFEEEFLRDIFPQTPQDLFTSLPIANNDSSINVVSHSTDQHVAEKPSSCILSFDKSTVLLPPTQQHKDPLKHSRNRRRSPTASLDHIMSERKRRKEITMKFIELSALLPGLKKTDKGYVLREAINHVKQLERRVKELEQDIKKRDMESVTNDVAIGEKNTEESYECNQSLPQVEAVVLGKEVLIRVYCVRQKGIVVDIMSQLQLHHLSITTSNILPFRNTLSINIVAQMDGDCNLIVKALVKKLRLVAKLQTYFPNSIFNGSNQFGSSAAKNVAAICAAHYWPLDSSMDLFSSYKSSVILDIVTEWMPMTFRPSPAMSLNDICACTAAYIFMSDEEDRYGREVLVKTASNVYGDRKTLKTLMPRSPLDQKQYALEGRHNPDYVRDIYQTRFMTSKSRVLRAIFLEEILCHESFVDMIPNYPTHSISSYPIEDPTSLKQQLAGSNDCGVWVCKWMIECPFQTLFEETNVMTSTRMKLALFLLHSGNNILLREILTKSAAYWKKQEDLRKKLVKLG
ncbi:uncharacterized protein LOC131651486 [Vicia villosa]|uniref:uncharacterized protein LOC131651486 n=1 Tax=Vicia villosa TaxID=3911 RepID=UPI00273C9E0C|nr:uncharacterized protein LOC131651486 [Vicia villosa]